MRHQLSGSHARVEVLRMLMSMLAALKQQCQRFQEAKPIASTSSERWITAARTGHRVRPPDPSGSAGCVPLNALYHRQRSGSQSIYQTRSSLQSNRLHARQDR